MVLMCAFRAFPVTGTASKFYCNELVFRYTEESNLSRSSGGNFGKKVNRSLV
jgi:hypothetical protein